MSMADASVVYDAVQIFSLFNFMNRIIEGTSVDFDCAVTLPTDAELEVRKTRSCMDFGREFGG